MICEWNLKSSMSGAPSFFALLTTEFIPLTAFIRCIRKLLSGSSAALHEFTIGLLAGIFHGKIGV